MGPTLYGSKYVKMILTPKESIVYIIGWLLFFSLYWSGHRNPILRQTQWLLRVWILLGHDIYNAIHRHEVALGILIVDVTRCYSMFDNRYHPDDSLDTYVIIVCCIPLVYTVWTSPAQPAQFLLKSRLAFWSSLVRNSQGSTRSVWPTLYWVHLAIWVRAPVQGREWDHAVWLQLGLGNNG